MNIIAHIHTDFGTKFGVPRQAGLIDELEGRIVFTPPYRVADALRGLEGFSHLWLIWDFSEAHRAEWSPTVRPPRLGGNQRMGVFATRSPFRPNPIGLSSVAISRIDLHTPEGPVIYIKGADLMDGTPIFDIKPYLAFTDAHPEARGGYTDETRQQRELKVVIPDGVAARFSLERLEALRAVLAHDPRPHYHDDPQRTYGMEFAGTDLHFRVADGTLTIIEQ